jgi:PAS domain S-box-containing protein
MADTPKKTPTPWASNQPAAQELEFIRYALDHTAIVAITDQAGTIIHVNDKFCEISKYPREELIGQNHRIINSGHHSPEFFGELWKTISSGEIWAGEIQNRAKDGGHYWVHTTIVPFCDEKGRPQQYVSIRCEITQKKQAEEQLRVYSERLKRSNQELESLAEERAQTTRALLDREAQILMQDRLASVGLLASSLAHEIGTPLGVIRGRAEYLEIQVQGEPNVKKNVDIILAQIDRVSKLIQSLLNIARGDQIHQAGDIHLNYIVSEVLELLGHEFRKNKISIKNELTTDIAITVKAESGPLHQVILNLLINAVHAIQTAIKTGRTEGHTITVSAIEMADQWALLIQDSGCGISEVNLKNLFKPFFTTKDIGKGTGLGLATSYGIVQSWGGSIEVKSIEHQGTEFKVLLPKVHKPS